MNSTYRRITVKNSGRARWLAALLLVLGCSYFLHMKGIAMPAPENDRYIRDLTMTSKFCPADFMPDGDLSKKVWRNAPRVKFDHDRMGHIHFPQSAMEVASVWTPDYVYFAYRCKYETLNTFEGEDPAKERTLLWSRDVVEVFINPQPDRMKHYYELEVAPNNQWVDLLIDLSNGWFSDMGWNSHFDHATKIDAQRHLWFTEMRIPVKSMEASAIRPGDTWRLNLYRLDGPGDDSTRRFLCWSPLPPGGNKSFHQPASFGIIEFVK
jgi:hypothetical protein